MLSDRLLSLLRNPETPTYALRDAVAEEDEPVRSVWLVVGSTGELGDDVWNVAVYFEYDAAVRLRDRLNDWCDDHRHDTHRGRQRIRRDGLKPPDDPRFRVEWGGTCYNVEEVPLRVGEGE